MSRGTTDEKKRLHFCLLSFPEFHFFVIADSRSLVSRQVFSGFINRVGNVNWPPLRVSKLTFRALALRQSERSNEGLTLETSALSICLLRPIHIINPVEKTKLSCYTPPPTKYHNFLRNLPPLFRYFPKPVLHKD